MCQRGKPLHFELHAAEPGNAIFYSPNKIQQARDLQFKKDEATQLPEASLGTEEGRERQLVEERKRIRAFSKVMREQEAEQKKQQKEEGLAKKADLQLQNDINQVKNGKKKVSIPSTPRNQKNIGGQDDIVFAEASATVNCRGRQKGLPQCFRDVLK
jgi:hypothetical protein